MILGQEPGKQHPVPVFVGELLGQLVDVLRLVGLSNIADLSATGAKPIPQFFLVGTEVRERLGRIDCPFLQRRTCRLLGLVAGRDADVLKLLAEDAERVAIEIHSGLALHDDWSVLKFFPNGLLNFDKPQPEILLALDRSPREADFSGLGFQQLRRCCRRGK